MRKNSVSSNMPLAIRAMTGFGKRMNVIVDSHLTEYVVCDMAEQSGLGFSLGVLREHLEARQGRRDFIFEITTDKASGGMQLFASVDIVGMGPMGPEKPIGHAIMTFLYWPHNPEISLQTFEVFALNEKGEISLKQPHLGLRLDRRDGKTRYTLEVEAVTAEAWKRVHDTIEYLRYCTRWDAVSKVALEHLSNITPKL